MELSTAVTFKTLGDIRHYRHRCPLNLTRQPEISGEGPSPRYLIDGLRQLPRLLPRDYVFKSIYLGHVTSHSMLNADLDPTEPPVLGAVVPVASHRLPPLIHSL